MTTEAIVTTTVRATELAEIIARVEPHVYGNDTVPILDAVHLDTDGTYLHAVASDRHTVAVARTRLRSGETWNATVRAADATALRLWATAHGHEAAVHLDSAPGELRATSNRGRIVLPTEASGPYPDWRGLFRKHLDEPAGPVDLAGFTSDYLRRWEAAGRRLHIAQAAADRPLIVFGEDFIGLQTPMRATTGAERATLEAAWLGSLGTTAGAIDLPLPDPTGAVADMTRDLLHRVTIATVDLFEADGSDPMEMALHGLSSGSAWMAYRLLQALQVTDPRLADRVLRGLDEELEAGDFSEIAYEDAELLGHDPEKWSADRRAQRKRRADEDAAQAAAIAAEQKQLAQPDAFPPNGGHTESCAYVGGISSRCTCST